MIKRTIATVGILLAIGSPIYGQKEASKPGSDQHQSGTAGNPTSPPSPKIKCVIKEDGTAIECDWPKGESDSYFHILFSAQSLPNLILVFVGIGGVVAAVMTIRSIDKQASLMKKQNKMIMSKERARVRIELIRDISTTPDQISHFGVIAKVSIFGITEAFIDKTEIEAVVGDYMGASLDKKRWKSAIDIPSVIRPNSEPHTIRAPLKKDSEFVGEEGFSDILKRRDDFVFFWAAIYYTDVFGRSWVVRLSKRWSYVTVPLASGGWGGGLGYWEEFGEPEPSGEYEIKNESKP